METEKLSQYVAERIRAGAGKDRVKTELTAIGWTEDDTTESVSSDRDLLTEFGGFLEVVSYVQSFRSVV